LTGLVTRLDERLIDRDYGAWAGISANDVIAQWGSLDAAPGVEAAAEVAKRAVAALSDIADEAWGSIALATLDPSLGHPEDVLQETGCFNILECHQGAMGRREWLVLGVNRVPPEVGELFSPTPAPPLLQ
jgi:broad specificity phosphatase PhoE